MKHYCRNRKRIKIVQNIVQIGVGSAVAVVLAVGLTQVAIEAQGPKDVPEYEVLPRVIQTYALSEEDVVELEAPIVVVNLTLTGYTTENVNVRNEPSTEGKILTTIKPFTTIRYIEVNDEWVSIEYQDDVAYIFSEYIQEGDIPEYVSYYLNSNGFKSFMGYKAITAKSSDQYKIQHDYAYTGEYGIRQVDGRFCVALGSAIDAKMGTYVDLVLENETIIPCILADQKADIHTMSDNLTTAANGCVSEFIVDTSALESLAARMGDVSYVDSNWRSPVVEIRVYPINIFD
ncbi:MAG: SH3 domain-containing protein [Ruminococcus flavefaciens]|nr:SH3 domain-containing protein [Ruminococcus flavefaciens]